MTSAELEAKGRKSLGMARCERCGVTRRLVDLEDGQRCKADDKFCQSVLNKQRGPLGEPVPPKRDFEPSEYDRLVARWHTAMAVDDDEETVLERTRLKDDDTEELEGPLGWL